MPPQKRDAYKELITLELANMILRRRRKERKEKKRREKRREGKRKKIINTVRD